MIRERKKSRRPRLPSLPLAAKASLYLLFSCFSALSLYSFHRDQPCTQNWIGLLGWSFSSFLLYFFGVSAFFIPLYFLWLSFLYFKKTPRSILLYKSAAFLSLPLCTCILLSMSSPVGTLPPILDTRLPKFILGNNPPVSYLGGIPFYLFYEGQSFCLKHLIGSVGTALIFGFLMLFSLLYLCGGIALLKKKTFQEGIKKNFFSFFRTCFKFLKKLINKRTYLPKPSVPFITKNLSPFSKPQSVSPRVSESIILDESISPTAQKESPSKKEAFFLTPHPCKRLLTKAIEPQETKVKEVKVIPLSQTMTLTGDPRGKEKLILPRLKSLAISEENLPQYHLLSKNEEARPESLQVELQKKAVILKQTLTSFGIDADIGNICSGPTLVAFEVLPHSGVKVQKIKSLENDIALKLQASSIRIIAPIPGKAAVGIEIPTPFPQAVNFRDLLKDYQKQHRKLQIPLLLGKKANGDNLWADLATMPHLIIAGTTGSGKSVCINTIVMSMIMTTLPSEIKLVIIDPKKVELTGYSQLPHMLSPVITESREVYKALVWLVKEMESRYEILRYLGLRNIQAFNSRTRNKTIEASYDRDIPETMPFMVGIIDELSDLLLSSSQDIETPIIRLAQMARAVGIHLILATQRPSREVITGLIKANFPSRISFKVANKVNSQIIIDEPGAENLMGNGDMLVLLPSIFGTIRAQGAYICDEDINKVIKDLCSRFPTQYVIPSFNTFDSCDTDNSGEKDPLFLQAKTLILQTGNASTTFLQRKLKIGYARAASLIDQLEEARIIGPSEGAKPRQILVEHPPREG
ncbi:Stage III sporulation protein E,DNA translocase FtsK,DNA segregation ATPase FtsK/SpoIIIE and related proteins,type VII secretion protein EssC,FtsK/SpoIIIE family [Chlamydia serpentis]|uniref:Stage III sporulation protein E,DNA translocase FtsK,DNA segregation ATPase FtsK/SpoIIIE and related proteins,type VII secretion protein EssC,FtsK/SpoIIIE family n=1 Tax=Chlamydia serpentis TaxID=1967782 RepID=A0A2R8FCD1_9CHLA|nr:DNA translocase FtsK [Chlamydia serpentis]SPN73992.1 Stage III sporulation protein E,DNA translocase FtsK,DNA segregation ATPase FtsK/SpoIIIE and related proteins,type VII secretion protein EssC,FtsK/SpoIIIE family [Chlamydia serpentis]